MQAYIHVRVIGLTANHSFATYKVPHRIKASDGQYQVLFLSRWRNVGRRGVVKSPENAQWRVTIQDESTGYNVRF